MQPRTFAIAGLAVFTLSCLGGAWLTRPSEPRTGHPLVLRADDPRDRLRGARDRAIAARTLVRAALAERHAARSH